MASDVTDPRLDRLSARCSAFIHLVSLISCLLRFGGLMFATGTRVAY